MPKASRAWRPKRQRLYCLRHQLVGRGVLAVLVIVQVGQHLRHLGEECWFVAGVGDACTLEQTTHRGKNDAVQAVNLTTGEV